MKGFLHCDWAEIIDYICILEVKRDKVTNETNAARFKETVEMSKTQLDSLEINIWNILSSPEYVELYDANKKIFELIDDIRDGKDVSSKEPDDWNIKRFKAKRRIQEKFFNSNLNEYKTRIND